MAASSQSTCCQVRRSSSFAAMARQWPLRSSSWGRSRSGIGADAIRRPPAAAAPSTAGPVPHAPFAPRRLGGSVPTMSPNPSSPNVGATPPHSTSRPANLGQLVESGWRSVPVKVELRRNAAARIASGEPLVDGVVGFEETVLPAVENAILAGQDLVFLGERGQAKTRMDTRLLVGLLDEWLPVVAGGELNDDPYRAGLAVGRGPSWPSWRPDSRSPGSTVTRRYGEKLATPDITIADLIGEVDPIKVAEGRYLSDELTLHTASCPALQPGHLRDQRAARPGRADPGRPAQHPPGSQRCPDPGLPRPAAARPLCSSPSANPEDYTSRGRIITPLKDRLRVADLDALPALRSSIEIFDRGARRSRRSRPTRACPASSCRYVMEELVAELTHLARTGTRGSASARACRSASASRT